LALVPVRRESSSIDGVFIKGLSIRTWQVSLVPSKEYCTFRILVRPKEKQYVISGQCGEFLGKNTNHGLSMERNKIVLYFLPYFVHAPAFLRDIHGAEIIMDPPQKCHKK
jgi:hypothetical protein